MKLLLGSWARQFASVVLLLVPVLGVAQAPEASGPLAKTKFGSLETGDAVPDFNAIARGGAEVKLSDFRGDTVLLTFVSGRGPSPLIQKTYEAYVDQRLVAIAVMSDVDRETFDAWVAKNGKNVTYTMAWDPAGRASDGGIAKTMLGFSSYPATIVINGEGKLVGGFIGFGSTTAEVLNRHFESAGLKPAPKEVPPPLPPSGAAGSDAATLEPGATAPDFVTKDLQGREVKLSDYRGKIVVLDFWASWCGPCVASMPHTETVAKTFKDQDVVVLASGTSEPRAAFENWVRANQEKYPSLIFSHDPAERGPDRASRQLYGVRGIPTQFVIDREGKIAAVLVGYGAGDTRLEAELAKLGVKK